MRSAFIRTVLLGCVCALSSLAQQQISVNQLVEFINSAVKMKQPDKDVAATLASFRLTQKLDPRVVEDLQGRGAGPRTVAALNKLAEESANLTPAPPKVEPPKPKPIPPPSVADQRKILDEVREYALNYTQSLPDFICFEVTRRYYDRRYKPGTEGSWAIQDRLVEKLSYFDQKEKYEPISQNDNSLVGKSSESLGGALSRNEFGTLLKEIFDPATDTEFRWERWGTLRGHLCHVYAYFVDQPHSKWTLDYDRRQQTTPGYNGLIFVDKESSAILRITIDPQPPADFPMQNIHQVLDYNYADISGQKFLLPLVSEVTMRADGVGTRNEIEFRSYRKYSADATITFSDNDDQQVPDDQKKEQPAPKQ
jgi:hypothetical protein